MKQKIKCPVCYSTLEFIVNGETTGSFMKTTIPEPIIFNCEICGTKFDQNGIPLPYVYETDANSHKQRIQKAFSEKRNEIMQNQIKCKVIAIDFDGCICENAYPEIGAPNWDVIHAALNEKRCGTKLILWTCREGVLLDEALTACRGWGLEFDAVNDSLPEWKRAWGNNPRKIGATEYWDDRAVRMPAIDVVTEWDYPCKDCETGWASLNTDGIKSCEDSCERLRTYMKK